MTAFALETLLLLFIMFVVGVIAGLMLRRARARRLALLRDNDEPSSLAFAATTSERTPEEGVRAPLADAPARKDKVQKDDPPQEYSKYVPANEGRGAQSQPGAASENDLSQCPPVLAAPEGGRADDLTRLKGVGPGNERKLHELGIFHIRQIAAWTPEQIDWVGRFLAFPGRVEREDWVGQARALLKKENGAD